MDIKKERRCSLEFLQATMYYKSYAQFSYIGLIFLLPNVMEVMKYIGAAYILWLAIHIVFCKPSTENAEQSASFLKGFMLQFVNVKIYMFGVTALTGYVVGYMSSFPALLFF